MKAEHLAASEAADRLALVSAAEGVRRVEQELQAAAAGNRFQRVDVAGAAPGVHADDAGGARRDHLFHLRRVNRVGARVDVAEYRRDLLPLQRVRRGDESERRHDYLAGQAEGPDGDFQRYRRVAHRHALPHPGELGKLRLELLDVRTVVCEPRAVEHVVDSFQQTFSIPAIAAPGSVTVLLQPVSEYQVAEDCCSKLPRQGSVFTGHCGFA